jgi:NDP-sugar pyrophosphorylase family protein
VLCGRGIRARSLGLGSEDYLHSKALLSVAGRPIIEWMVQDLSEQGVREVLVAADSADNRAQAEAVLGDGRRLGARVRFAEAGIGTSMAELVLTVLADWPLADPLLVVPTDALFRFDLHGLHRQHQETGSVVTVAAVRRSSSDVAGRHDVLRFDADRRLTGVVPRPTAAELHADVTIGSGSMLPVDAGMYMVDPAALRRLSGDSHLPPTARSGQDWARDLLPWLIGRGRGQHVTVHLIGGMGGVDTPREYLQTVHTTLRGGFGLLRRRLDGYVELRGQRWVHESTLALVEETSGRTLQQRLVDGSVYLGPGVRLGRGVRIRNGVRVTDADIGDDVSLGEGCLLERVACGRGSMVGPHAQLQDCFLGSHVEIQSTAQTPTRIGGFSVLSDQTRVMPGARIYQVSVYPRLAIPGDRYLPEGLEVASPDVVETLGTRPASIPWPA